MLGDDDDVLLADVAHTLALPPLTLFHLTAFCFMCQRIRTLPLIIVIVWSLNLSKIIFGVEKTLPEAQRTQGIESITQITPYRI